MDMFDAALQIAEGLTLEFLIISMYYAIHCNSKSRCVHVTLARHVTCINMYIHVSLQDVTG